MYLTFLLLLSWQFIITIRTTYNSTMCRHFPQNASKTVTVWALTKLLSTIYESQSFIVCLRPKIKIPSWSMHSVKLRKRVLSTFFQNIPSKFQCGFRNDYSTQHYLSVMLEKWQLAVDNNEAFGVLLSDLSKDFKLFKSWPTNCEVIFLRFIINISKITKWFFIKSQTTNKS